MSNDGNGSRRLECRLENGLEGQASLTSLGVLVKNILEGKTYQA